MILYLDPSSPARQHRSPSLFKTRQPQRRTDQHVDTLPRGPQTTVPERVDRIRRGGCAARRRPRCRPASGAHVLVSLAFQRGSSGKACLFDYVSELELESYGLGFSLLVFHASHKSTSLCTLCRGLSTDGQMMGNPFVFSRPGLIGAPMTGPFEPIITMYCRRIIWSTSEI